MRPSTRILTVASIAAAGLVGLAGTASALPIRDVMGQPPTVVIVDPPPPTTMPPVTLPPYTVPPTTVATPPTTATPPPNNNGGSNNEPVNNSPTNNGPSRDASIQSAIDTASDALPALGVDEVAAAPSVNETERGSSFLILVGAVVAASLASLGAGLFLRRYRRQA